MAKFRMSSTWWPTAALSASSFICGIAAALVFLLGAETDREVALKDQLLQANSRIEAFESARSSINLALAAALPRAISPAQHIETQPETQADRDGAAPENTSPVATVDTKEEQTKPAPAPASVAPPKPPPAKAAPAKSHPAPVAKPPQPKPAAASPAAAAPKPASPKAEPPKQVSAALRLPLPGDESPAAPTATAAAPAVANTTKATQKTPPPVSEAELKHAIATNSIELAPKSKMGVEKVTPDAVVMSSGSTVRIGDRFTSGERLLSVDKETGRIVTDKRTVMIEQ